MLGLTGSQEQDSDSLLSLAQSLHRHFMIFRVDVGCAVQEHFEQLLCVFYHLQKVAHPKLRGIFAV